MEPLVLKVGTAVVSSAVKSWLTSRKGELASHPGLHQLYQRALPFEVPDFDDGERSAALAEVADAFERADLADADLFEVDVDPAKLARRLRATLPDAAERAGLGEAATWFHRRVGVGSARGGGRLLPAR